MENALIISSIEKELAFFTEMLNADSVNKIIVLKTAGEARRLILEQDFDLVIINAPLQDETGESLAQHIAVKGLSQVILVVKSEYFDVISSACENDGVLTISKPVDRAIFWSALKLAGSVQSRLKRMQTEDGKVKQKIEDIRIINRAKWILITHFSMSEQEAHRFIEKQAMDMRSSKRSIAEGILNTYAN